MLSLNRKALWDLFCGVEVCSVVHLLVNVMFCIPGGKCKTKARITLRGFKEFLVGCFGSLFVF